MGIVSDSNNHRLQIFDVNGKVLTTFGSEGTEEGQFKFPRGVAVDEQGFIFVADSGNNRIQIFNPDGTFLRAFGRWGQNDGEFKGLEGIAVNSKERDPCYSWTFVESFWWGLMTLTTVGYDLNPKTLLGKL